jgi:catechol 2,3-dioxygenase-like lactoylglutathione lyase family enzyme
MAAAAGAGLSRIGQIAITVQDFGRAVAFYRDRLGLRFLFEAPPSLAFFDCDGVRLMLSPPEQEGSAAGQRFNSVLYFRVDDIQQTARDLEARGVGFEQPPHRIAPLPHADLWMGFFRDPDGNLLAIMSEVPRA